MEGYVGQIPISGPELTIYRISSSFVLDNVNCVGTETSVFDCPHNGEGVHNCGSAEWAGVKCNTGD